MGRVRRSEPQPQDEGRSFSVTKIACCQQLTSWRADQRSSWDPRLSSFAAVVHSSCSRIVGSTDSARCAGIHVATSPSNDMARTTPANTSGSRGVA